MVVVLGKAKVVVSMEVVVLEMLLNFSMDLFVQLVCVNFVLYVSRTSSSPSHRDSSRPKSVPSFTANPIVLRGRFAMSSI